jgi:hypothetical protein
VVRRQGTSCCRRTHTATEAARRSGRVIPIRRKEARLAITVALSAAELATIRTFLLQHGRRSRGPPAHLGPDGFLESVGHFPCEVPCHDSGMLEPLAGTLSQHAQPVSDRFPARRLPGTPGPTGPSSATLGAQHVRCPAAAIYSVNSKSRFLFWAGLMASTPSASPGIRSKPCAVRCFSTAVKLPALNTVLRMR